MGEEKFDSPPPPVLIQDMNENSFIIDGLVKSPSGVIPAKAGIGRE